MKRDDAIAEMERLLAAADAEGRDFSEEEQERFNEMKLIALEPQMDMTLDQPTAPLRPVAPALHLRERPTPGSLLRSAIALACNERGVDTGIAVEFDKEVRRRNPHRKFEGAVAITAKALLIAKAVSALPAGNAAATAGEQWMDNLFFRTDDAIAGPRLATALGVNVIAATEDKVHITKLDGRVVPGWIARDGDVPDSDASFDAVEVSPKTIGANVLVKRSALLYGTHPQVEPLLLQDMREAVLDALDSAVLFGTGASNQPTGVSVVAQAGGALDTLADAYLIRNQLLAYQRSDEGMRWLLPDLAEGKLATSPAWTGATIAALAGNTFAGYPYVVRPLANISSPLATTQEYLAGNFGFVHLVVWDAVSLLANPFGAGYKSGSVELRVLADANVLVRDEKRLFKGDASILAAA